MGDAAKSESREQVLVVGYRRGLCAALERLGVDFALWHPSRRKHSGAVASHVAPITPGRRAVGAAIEALAPHGPFSHVLAGTEAAVVPTAMLRRRLGARRSAIRRAQLCHDKLAMKRHLARHGIPMTDFRGGEEPFDPRRLLAELGSPVVVKMRTGSGSRGIRFANDVNTLAEISPRGRLYERFVDAEEASVESFVHRGRIVFTNVTRYLARGRINMVPADLPRSLQEELRTLNRRVLEALRIEWGMTHLEFFLADGGALVSEIALRPPGGYLMELLDLTYGGDAWGAFVAVELDRPLSLPQQARAVTAAVILHPGAGVVRAIRGLDEVRGHPNVVDARIKVGPGDEITPRVGLGQDVGRALLRADDPAKLRQAIAFVERQLTIEI